MTKKDASDLKREIGRLTRLTKRTRPEAAEKAAANPEGRVVTNVNPTTGRKPNGKFGRMAGGNKFNPMKCSNQGCDGSMCMFNHEDR